MSLFKALLYALPPLASTPVINISTVPLVLTCFPLSNPITSSPEGSKGPCIVTAPLPQWEMAADLLIKPEEKDHKEEITRTSSHYPLNSQHSLPGRHNPSSTAMILIGHVSVIHCCIQRLQDQQPLICSWFCNLSRASWGQLFSPPHYMRGSLNGGWKICFRMACQCWLSISVLLWWLPLWPGWASHNTVVSGYMAEDFSQSPKYKLPGLPKAQVWQSVTSLSWLRWVTGASDCQGGNDIMVWIPGGVKVSDHLNQEEKVTFRPTSDLKMQVIVYDNRRFFHPKCLYFLNKIYCFRGHIFQVLCG